MTLPSSSSKLQLSLFEALTPAGELPALLDRGYPSPRRLPHCHETSILNGRLCHIGNPSSLFASTLYLWLSVQGAIFCGSLSHKSQGPSASAAGRALPALRVTQVDITSALKSIWILVHSLKEYLVILWNLSIDSQEATQEISEETELKRRSYKIVVPNTVEYTARVTLWAKVTRPCNFAMPRGCHVSSGEDPGEMQDYTTV
ncbi:hypothetical protein L2E82_11784 [Cichorium intybus]|uniref:Uncharacterized protein n=1 Tax=Cichorium intybus TaxID=13427 RepID=A0ACB9GFG4_CICIN|nr:hypothetical protein L2E82_11784 [Cichorium intybus]